MAQVIVLWKELWLCFIQIKQAQSEFVFHVFIFANWWIYEQGEALVMGYDDMG